MEFSVAGVVISVLTVLPTLLLLIFPPRTGLPQQGAGPGRVISFLETAGRAACLLLACYSGASVSRLGLGPFFWLCALSIAFYALLEARYIATRDFSMLYRPAFGLPIPMAVTHALIFIFFGAWSGFAPLLAAALVFALGHFAGSWSMYSSIKEGERQ